MFALHTLTAVLLLGISNVLTDEVCLVGDFDSQLQRILESQRISTQEVARISVLRNDVRNTLKKHWKDVQVSLFGSLFIGLGTTASDVDLLVQMPNVNDTFIEDISKLLQQQHTLYSNFTISTAFKNPVLTFYHIPTQRYCDIINDRTNGFETTKVFKYYFNLDKRYRQLGLFLKFWLRVHYNNGHKDVTKFRNYTLYTLVVFFLQQMSMIPSGYELQEHFEGAENNYTNSWNLSFNKLSYNSTNADNMYKLLGGFFKYYSEFNFQDNIISPFVGRPIDKRSFMDVECVPQEFSLYKTLLSKHLIEPLVLNSELCIQEFFEHDRNIVDKIGREEASRFIARVKYAAKMYDELPSDRFLGAIVIPIEDEIIESKEIDAIRQPKDDLNNKCIKFL